MTDITPEHPLIYPYFDADVRHYADPKAYQKIAKLLPLQKNRQNLPLVKVVKQGEPVQFRLKSPAKTHWQLQLEDGSLHQGNIKKGQLELPTNLPLGYHSLTLGSEHCRLIVTPEKAYQPPALQQQQKLWGAIVQLYTLRSEQNWGIGDFGDLKQFLINIAAKGGHFVGLNPIHALFPANPDAASPYSPSSRLWLNVLYISVENLPEFRQSSEAQAWFAEAETQYFLYEARQKEWVDYRQVAGLKLYGLWLAYHYFCTQPQHEFEQFIAGKGEALTIQATFDALHHRLAEQSGSSGGWGNWLAKFQDYRTACVRQFQQDEETLVRFYMWLQFVAAAQLRECHELAQSLNMPIGFYRDLAVGVANNGAETWADKELYVLDAAIGAPPDLLAPQGQNWGLSPMNPQVLQARAYQPFIDLLRANMQHCGALRIDHILGFARMWWVAEGESAEHGVYVKYPLDDLLAILALESQRHQCVVIAEALGTVPSGMLEALEQKGILAYNIFYFEYENGASKPLENYPYAAMTTLSTHDLPTVQGYWKCYDFELGDHFGIYPNEAVRQLLQETRHNNKLAIRAAVEAKQPLEPDSFGISQTFTHQLQCYVADTNSALFGTQPEDWLNLLEPVNIPGTSNEYPNWRRKLPKTIEELFNDPAVSDLLQKIAEKRQKQTACSPI